MDKKTAVLFSRWVLGSSLTLVAATSFATDSNIYWKSSDGQLTDGSGRCVQAAQWHDKSQVVGCDVINPVRPAVVVVADGDQDGVADTADRCPATPKGQVVDSLGCERDSDADGVADSNDNCAGTPTGIMVDARGCAQVVLKPVSYDLKVQFANNSSVISSHYGADFKRVAELLAKDPGLQVVVHGHADSTGTVAYNRWLSQRRADKVMAMLVNRYGVQPNQLSAIGHGEALPVADNRNAQGRQQNRRVEAAIRILIAAN